LTDNQNSSLFLSSSLDTALLNQRLEIRENSVETLIEESDTENNTIEKSVSSLQSTTVLSKQKRKSSTSW
ncbi:1219_t:CDS:1, partial [Acaulospora colombiana]